MVRLQQRLGIKTEGLRLRLMFAFFGFVIVAFFFTLRSSINAYKLLFEMQCPEAQSLSSQPTVLTTNAVTAGGVTTEATMAITTQEPEGKGDQQQQAGITISEHPKQEAEIPVEVSQLAAKTTAVTAGDVTTEATMAITNQEPEGKEDQQQQAGISISEHPKQEAKIPVEVSQLAAKTTAAVRKEPDTNFPRAYDSYNTTDLIEFKDRHRNYLLRRQEELEGTEFAHLSTRAKGTDILGNSITTYSYANFYNYGFNSGFRNQIMAFSMLVIRANFNGHEQLLLDSLYHKDIDGSKKFSRFEMYFDVDHWNSYSRQGLSEEYSKQIDSDEEYDHYPNYLPRLVLSDPKLHKEWNGTSSRFIGRASNNSTQPYCYYQRDSMLFSNYMFYAKGRSQFTPTGKKGKTAELTERNPADILMLQGALRPNPAMQAIIDKSKKHLLDLAKQRTGGASSTPFRYMTLHARVEPDMQHHPVCRDKKVYTLREIVEMIESKWKGPPPVEAVFLPINRRVLEKEGKIKPKDYIEPSKRPKRNSTDTEKGPKPINWYAVDNLRLLNQLTNRDGKGGGLWNGTVPVVEFGFDALRGTVYETRPTIGGAIHDYWLALDAHIFIGTEVSSFSHDILAARFFRGANDSGMKNNNYKYLPSGLHEWINDAMISPPGMTC